jgi:hypothetical protein
MRKQKNYKIQNFAWDVFMTFLTGGLWFVWIIIREFQIQKR